MGLRGPVPTPTAILEMRGSEKARRAIGEPRFEIGTPSCPAWLGKEAKAEWRRQVRQLKVAGLLTLADRGVLVAYCEAWGEFALAVDALADGGHTYTTEAGYVGKSPYVAIKHSAVERLLKLSDRFGFSPAARARVRAADPKRDNQDADKAKFFRTG